MLDALWTIFLGSVLIVAILLTWIVIYSFAMTVVKQWKRDHHGNDNS